MHLWHQVGEIVPIIPLECLWINHVCMNTCCSLAVTKKWCLLNGEINKRQLFLCKNYYKENSSATFESKAKRRLISLFMDHFSSIPWPGAETTFRYFELRWLVTLYKKTIDIWAFFLLSSLLFLLSFSDVYQSTAGKIVCSAHGYFCEDVIVSFFLVVWLCSGIQNRK